MSWPQIRADNPAELERYSAFLKECLNAIKNVSALSVLEFSENMKRIVGKLPYNLHDRWRSIVRQTKDKGEPVTFKQLVSFVSLEAKKLTVYGRLALNPEKKPAFQ